MSFILANAGTPLLITWLLHLYLGNILLGVLEGSLLVLLFRKEARKELSTWLSTIGVMIAANFVSWWLGSYLLLDCLLKFLDVTIVNYWKSIYLFIALAFVITLFIECGFFLYLFRKNKRRLRDSIQACLLVHVVSYLLLIMIYYRSTEESLVRELKIVDMQEMKFPSGYEVYYISQDDTKVYAFDFGSKKKSTVLDLGGEPKNRILIASNHSDGTNSIQHSYNNRDGWWDYLIDYEALRKHGKEIIRGEHIALIKSEDLVINRNHEGELDGYAKIANFNNSSKFIVGTKQWGLRGIYIFKQEKLIGEYKIESVIANWLQHYPVHLPGDLVLFQLGSNQICVLDIKEKNLALVDRGKSPVVMKRIGY